MRKLIVCGASWMTAITGDDRHKHFTEIVAKKFDAEYLNLAHPGVDNVSICLQIERALKHKLNADAIFVGIDDEHRICVPKNNCKEDTRFVWKNLSYHHPTIQSTEHHNEVTDHQNGYFESYGPMSLRDHDESLEKQPQIKTYLEHFYKNMVATQLVRQQVWMLSYWFDKIIERGIKLKIFAINTNPIKVALLSDQKYAKFVVKENIPYDGWDNTSDKIYHTSNKHQFIVADKVIKLCK